MNKFDISLLVATFLVAATTIYLCVNASKEDWSNGYSGWPGPIENGSGRYNIPALYGRGAKYSDTSLRYKDTGPGPYMKMRGYPE